MRQFTCAGCGFTYNTTTTPEDRDAESAALYAGTPDEEMASTCDGCWQKSLEYIASDETRIEAPRAKKLLGELS